MLVLTHKGAEKFLLAYFGSNDLELKLFTNDHIPEPDDHVSYYLEAVGGGYSSQLLVGGDWSLEMTVPRYAIYPEQVFNFSGSLNGNPTVFGYYVVDMHGDLVWSEQLTMPFTPGKTGNTIKISPLFQISHGVPSA